MPATPRVAGIGVFRPVASGGRGNSALRATTGRNSRRPRTFTVPPARRSAVTDRSPTVHRRLDRAVIGT